MTPAILIYQDYVHNNGALHRALQPYGQVGFCDAADIIDGVLSHNTSLLVMPGGADLYFCGKLNGAGNAAIRAYVETGGSYLGICAGAYYACNNLSWAVGSDQEITGQRDLGFFPETAIGPALSMIQGITQSWLGVAELLCEDGTRTLSCYEAGPYFTNTDDQTHIIARYATLPGQPPAIIERNIGAGRALLSGTHIERLMPWAKNALNCHNNPSYDYESGIYDTLSSDCTGQKRLLDNIMKRLLDKSKGLSYAA